MNPDKERIFQLLRSNDTIREKLKILHSILHRMILRRENSFPVGDLTELFNEISAKTGPLSAFHLISRLEISLRLRKPTLAIYDHTFHIIGGGQKYGLLLANILKNDLEITLIANKPFTHQDIQNWYGLNLNSCKIKLVPLSYFESTPGIHLDPGRIFSRSIPNPFHPISHLSANYDIFVNNSMNEMVYPLSPLSMVICHFPERRPRSYFYMDRYDYIIYNSRYTAGWIEIKWKIHPHYHIYPPNDLDPGDKELIKENMIISVARFEQGGSKKQLEMVRSFFRLSSRHDLVARNWRLVLIGGSIPENPYLEKIRDFIREKKISNIEIQHNISVKELRNYYQKAKIFWHLCGLNQEDPALVEHFGMTIVEAMQNGCVPIVFKGGGQVEIVEEGISGFQVTSTAELARHTWNLINHPKQVLQYSGRARERSKLFSVEKFAERVHSLFTELIPKHFYPQDQA